MRRAITLSGWRDDGLVQMVLKVARSDRPHRAVSTLFLDQIPAA
jgi:hypothetical protein